MRRPMLLAAAGLLLAAGASATAEADAYSARRGYGYAYGEVVQVPQGVGCYWFRGRLYCSRYCYWEIDGTRYCTRRLRDAESQAPELLPGDMPYPPYGRYRSVK